MARTSGKERDKRISWENSLRGDAKTNRNKRKFTRQSVDFRRKKRA